MIGARTIGGKPVAQQSGIKLSETQREVYRKFFEKIGEVNLIDANNAPEDGFTKLIELLEEFERSCPFLDERTIKVFNEQISMPFNNGTFVKMFHEKGEDAVYNEVRRRLMSDVLPTARAFLET